MKKFEFRSDIALSDCAFYAYGKNVADLIVNACQAVTEAMVNWEKIEIKDNVSFETQADSLEDLLFKVLDEVIYLKDSKQLIFHDFEIKKLEEEHESYNLSMKFAGEKIDRGKHESHSDVKAVTYHQFAVEKTPEGYRASVILDV